MQPQADPSGRQVRGRWRSVVARATHALAGSLIHSFLRSPCTQQRLTTHLLSPGPSPAPDLAPTPAKEVEARPEVIHEMDAASWMSPGHPPWWAHVAGAGVSRRCLLMKENEEGVGASGWGKWAAGSAQRGCHELNCVSPQIYMLEP